MFVATLHSAFSWLAASLFPSSDLSESQSQSRSQSLLHRKWFAGVVAPLSILGQISRIPSLLHSFLPSFLHSFVILFSPFDFAQLISFRILFRVLFDYGWDLLRGQFPCGDDINWREDNEDGHVFFLLRLSATHIHFHSCCIMHQSHLPGPAHHSLFIFVFIFQRHFSSS